MLSYYNTCVAVALLELELQKAGLFEVDLDSTTFARRIKINKKTWVKVVPYSDPCYVI